MRRAREFCEALPAELGGTRCGEMVHAIVRIAARYLERWARPGE